MQACFHGQHKTMRLLVEAGAIPTQRDIAIAVKHGVRSADVQACTYVYLLRISGRTIVCITVFSIEIEIECIITFIHYFFIHFCNDAFKRPHTPCTL